MENQYNNIYKLKISFFEFQMNIFIQILNAKRNIFLLVSLSVAHAGFNLSGRQVWRIILLSLKIVFRFILFLLICVANYFQLIILKEIVILYLLWSQWVLKSLILGFLLICILL